MKDFEYKNGIFIYYLPKELDHFAADKLKNKTADLFDENIRYLVFDFKNTVLMDSSGIGLITGRYRKVHDNGGMVYVINVNEKIDKLLLMSGIYRIVSKRENSNEIINELLEEGYYE